MNVQTAKRIACGNRRAHGFTPGFQHHHASVADVRQCHASGGVYSLEEASQGDLDTYDPDAAYERHLESAGYNEARHQEDMEAAMGVVSFSEGMRAAEAALGSPRLTNADGETVREQASAVHIPLAGERLLDGIYTLQTDTGHRTFQVKTQPSTEDFLPGRQIIAYLSGANNEADYTRFAHVVPGAVRVWRNHSEHAVLLADLAAFAADPDAALRAGHCYRCGRTLTTPESLASGFGPTCAGKGTR